MQILIIGLGLIGGSIAQKLNSQHQIIGVDKCLETLKIAQQQKVISKGYQFKIPLNIYQDTDLVIVCLYPKATIDFLKEQAKYFKKETIFVDVSGLQAIMKKELTQYLNDNKIGYVSLHPMAGREKGGFTMAMSTLFDNKSLLYTNLTASKEQVEKVLAIVNQLGFAKIKEVEPQVHDQIIAYTSQLPHIISASYMNTWSKTTNLNGFTGGSFEDLTRIAAINEKLWSELFIMNKQYLIKELKCFRKNIDDFLNALEVNDIIKLENLMKQSRQQKLKID